jgi:hypothetical protein
MNERGTYGRSSMMNGHGAHGIQGWAPPSMGMDVETKRDVVMTGFDVAAAVLTTLAGLWVGSKATPADPKKGGTIGAAVGYFAFLLAGQKTAMENVAKYTKEIARR